jgi:hypothetical protein
MAAKATMACPKKYLLNFICDREGCWLLLDLSRGRFEKRVGRWRKAAAWPKSKESRGRRSFEKRIAPTHAIVLLVESTDFFPYVSAVVGGNGP